MVDARLSLVLVDAKTVSLRRLTGFVDARLSLVLVDAGLSLRGLTGFG